jgi:gluconate 2-dehydrogenase gamma chain
MAADDPALSLYRSGAAALNADAARLRAGARFADLDDSQQDELLARLDERADPFFRRLVLDTLEGFYGDPRHGGNDDAVSWRMIGFPGPTGGRGYEPPLGWYDATVSDESG